MRRWAPALIIFGGIVVTISALVTLGMLYACLAALGTVAYAAFAPSIVGTARVRPGASVDPAEVRRWREAHPGATVSEAIQAVSK